MSSCCCYSVAKLRPHGLRHARLPCQSASSRSLLKLMSNELTMPSNHLILCRPLLLLPPIFPSIRVFSKESVLRGRWPKYWSFSFSISPSNEYLGLLSFRMDWFDLLAIQVIKVGLHIFYPYYYNSIIYNPYYTLKRRKVEVMWGTHSHSTDIYLTF